jgi:hypothetical protein
VTPDDDGSQSTDGGTKKRRGGYWRSLMRGPARDRDDTPAEWRLLGLAAASVGVVAIVLFAVQFDGRQIASVIAMALALAGASWIAGALLGFLFGIPRSVVAHASIAPRDDAGPTATPEPRYYRPNTNLEEISDWLTKIIVGIGLVQIGRATSALGRFANSIGPALGDGPDSPGFGLTIVVFYAILGFLVSYLWTQLSYRGQLHQLEINLEREHLDEHVAPPTIGAPKADDSASLTAKPPLEIPLQGEPLEENG